ncbi:MAG: hypothetical protein AAGE52_11030 [Myxococcota bacterium]
MTKSVLNGDLVEMNFETFATLLAEPVRWGNLTIAIEVRGRYPVVVYRTHDEGPHRLLVVIDGSGPYRDAVPEVVSSFDGGSEPFLSAAGFFLEVDEAVALLGDWWERGERPASLNGVALRWGNPALELDYWRELGDLDEQDDFLEEDIFSLVYWSPPGFPEAAAVGGGYSFNAAFPSRPLESADAGRIGGSAMWNVLRKVSDVEDPRWLALIAEHGMPWLRDLSVGASDLRLLGAALRVLPRLRELCVHADANEIPPLKSSSLRSLVLDLKHAARTQRVIDELQMPALYALLVFRDALDAPIDFSRLSDVVVMVEGVTPEDVSKVNSAARLSLGPPSSVSAAALVDALGTRVGETHFSPTWSHAQEARELARARGLSITE